MHSLIQGRFSIRLGWALCVVMLASCGGSDTAVVTDTTVPNVVGETQASATYNVGVTGLKVGTVTTAFSTTVPAGTVISQTPSYGTQEPLSTPVNLVVSSGPSPDNFAFVPDGGAGTLSAYAVNSTTGVLTPIAGSPVAVAGSVRLAEAKVDPSDQFLYVTDDTSPGKVYAFSIDQSSGTLTAIAGSPFAAGNGSRSLAFDASGGFLYVANSVDGTVSAFSLSTSTGVLTALAASPYAISGTAEPSQLARAGNFLYVADTGASSIQAFAITSSGTLTQAVAGSPFATGGAPSSIAVDPAGSVLYASNSGQSISGYTINASTGQLTMIAGSPLAILASNNISIDPQGRFLFVTETNGVSVYPIGSGGILGAPAAGSPFVAGSLPYSVGFDPTGQFAYVGNDGSANVSEFSIATTGVLAPLAGSPVAAGANPDFVVTN